MLVRKNLKFILAALVAVGLAAGAWVLWGGAMKTLVADTMALLREAGPVLFFGAMAVLPMAGFPLSPFTVAAGPVFAPQMGAGWVIVCGVGAVAINVSLSYWLAAQAMRPLIAKGLTKLGRGLPEGPVKSGLELTLILRVVPGTPFFLQSYLLGLARVSFWKIYLPISVAVPSLYISGMVLAGDAVGRGDKRLLAAALVLLLAVGTGMHFLRRRLKRRAAAEAAVSPEAATEGR